MLGEEIRDRGLPACAYDEIPASLSLKHPGSISLDTLSLGHGISLLGWRRGSFMRPHGMPLRFKLSPPSGDSSSAELAVQARCSFDGIATTLEERSWLEKRTDANLSKSPDWRHRD